MDILSLLGIILAFVAILGGNLLEGGAVGSLFNGPAGLIVVGGTLAATILQTSWPMLKRAMAQIRWVFVPPYISLEDGIGKVIDWSVKARKQGLLGLEGLAEREPEKFARKGLQLLVDGAEPEAIRSIMEVDLESREQRDLEAARIYEAMGGYSPTIGIIGAVMGLIQVMTNLEDPQSLGSGIASEKRNVNRNRVARNMGSKKTKFNYDWEKSCWIAEINKELEQRKRGMDLL